MCDWQIDEVAVTKRELLYHSRLVTNTAQKLRDDKDEVGC